MGRSLQGILAKGQAGLWGGRGPGTGSWPGGQVARWGSGPVVIGAVDGTPKLAEQEPSPEQNPGFPGGDKEEEMMTKHSGKEEGRTQTATGWTSQQGQGTDMPIAPATERTQDKEGAEHKVPETHPTGVVFADPRRAA